MINFGKLPFYNKMSAKDSVQVTNLSQKELKENDTFQKKEKKTIFFETSDPEDVINEK